MRRQARNPGSPAAIALQGGLDSSQKGKSWGTYEGILVHLSDDGSIQIDGRQVVGANKTELDWDALAKLGISPDALQDAMTGFINDRAANNLDPPNQAFVSRDLASTRSWDASVKGARTPQRLPGPDPTVPVTRTPPLAPGNKAGPLGGNGGKAVAAGQIVVNTVNTGGRLVLLAGPVGSWEGLRDAFILASFSAKTFALALGGAPTVK